MQRIDRRAFLRSGAATTAGLVLWGCSGDGGDGDRTAPTTAGEASTTTELVPVERVTLRLPGSAFGFPSPFAYISGLGYYQMSFLYDSLLWKDASGELLPWLAESFEASGDGLTYVFELRGGVRWHDGRPVTADDVVFTFDYFKSLLLGGLVIAQPQGVAGATATGPSTVEVRLDRPAVTFPEFVAGALPIVPRHVWADIDDPAAAQDVEVLVGSGPYRLDEYDPADGALAYVANDEHFLGRPFVERVELRPVGDELTALMAGEIDATGPTLVSVRPEVVAPFRADDAYGIVEQPSGFTYPLYWNLARGGPLADATFRRACALAIDRADIATRLLGDNGVPGNPGFVPPDHPFHVEVEQYAFDPGAAAALLDDAGYERPLRFELLFSTDATAVAELVIATLGAVGIELGTRPVELGPALFGAKLNGDYDMMLTLYPGPGGPPPAGDPDYLRQIFSSRVPPGLASAGGWSNERFDELADEQLAALDEQERGDLLAEMQRILADEVPVLPLYYANLLQVYRRAVLDQWYFTPGGFPVGTFNKQLFVTGLREGLEVRPTK